MKRLQGSKSLLGFLAGILLLVLMGSYEAQAAWTKSENSRVNALEKKIRALEAKLNGESQEKRTLQFLTIAGAQSAYPCPLDSKPVKFFPFSGGNYGYGVPARVVNYGDFKETIILTLCETEYEIFISK